MVCQGKEALKSYCREVDFIIAFDTLNHYHLISPHLQGMKEYTQSGYLSAAKSFDPADLEADCSGKEFMITGSNSGIGKVAALEIAKRGGSVHMICRFVVLNRASMNGL